METVVAPPADAELHLLTQWGDPIERSRTRKAAVLSVLAHVILIATLVLIPAEVSEKPEPEPQRHITPLYLPLTLSAEKAPPKQGKVSKEIHAADLEPQRPRPRIQSPPGGGSSRASGAPLPPAPAPKQTAAAPPPPPPALPEPPKVEAAPPKQTPAIAPPVVTPPPQIQSEEAKNKSPFTNPTSPAPVNPNAHSPFGNPIEEAINQATHTPSGNLTLGDRGIFGPGSGQSQVPPVLGQPGSGLEMLTSDQGVDFRPYLARVLNEVRRHWLAIIPESVKLLGRRGAVAIQFAIDRQGGVPKLVIVPGLSSGVDALDRAAVAGISASVPFPPLPAEFKGDRIVLQFNFAYNMPKR
jgi:TonB family protein